MVYIICIIRRRIINKTRTVQMRLDRFRTVFLSPRTASGKLVFSDRRTERGHSPKLNVRGLHACGKRRRDYGRRRTPTAVFYQQATVYENFQIRLTMRID